MTLVARDANGNQETGGGLTVSLWPRQRHSAGGTFGTVTDNGDGTYTATFTGTTAGSNTITATIGGQKVTSTLHSTFSRVCSLPTPGQTRPSGWRPR